MNKSENIAKLAKALVGFQAEVATIGTDKKNPFFKNEYATLGQLIEDTKKLREKYGLAVSQIPIGEGGLITMLLHESGEYLSATSEIRLEAEKGNSLAQSAGKLITYQRRYAYAAILGLVSDKDADGNMKEPTPPPTPATPPPAKMTRKQGMELIAKKITVAIDEQAKNEIAYELTDTKHQAQRQSIIDKLNAGAKPADVLTYLIEK